MSADPTTSPELVMTDVPDESLSPSKIEIAATKVDVSALLTGLSPMQKKHFTGELVDEHKSMRFVGFEPAQ